MPNQPERPTLPSPARLRELLQSLAHGLLERETAVHLALLTALAGEHLLLIGPPGTAKSALARRLQSAFEDARWFERLLTRFSTPEELFGPLSLKALEHDRYERLVDGFLPSAGIAFLDEVFKANSAILNALLTLLNERAFDNGTVRLKAPLVAVIAASNEVPSDDALHAFYDRFLVRLPVAPVGDAAFGALLALDEQHAAPALHSLSAAERQAVTDAATQLPLGADFTAGCGALRQWLAERKAPLSDRRWRQLVGLVRTAAASEGRTAVDVLDLWLAPYVANAKPDDVPPLQEWFANKVALAAPQPAPWLQQAVLAFEQQLGTEQQRQDRGGGGLGDSAAELESGKLESGKLATGKLAIARAHANPQADAETAADQNPEQGLLRMQSAALQAQLAHRFSRCHIEARVAQVQAVEEQVAAAAQQWQSHHHWLQQRLQNRLWMPQTLRSNLLQGPALTLALLQSCAERLAVTREGFAALPADDNQSGSAPRPVAWAAAAP